MIIQYEETSYANISDNSTHLLKTKDVIEMYPALTLYSLNKAIKEEKIPVIKIGNLNYFTEQDIENFIHSQTLKRGNKL